MEAIVSYKGDCSTHFYMMLIATNNMQSFLNVTIKSETCSFLQQHLRKWMEVVVITHKGGQRSDGSVSIHNSDNS